MAYFAPEAGELDLHFGERFRTDPGIVAPCSEDDPPIVVEATHIPFSSAPRRPHQQSIVDGRDSGHGSGVGFGESAFVDGRDPSLEHDVPAVDDDHDQSAPRELGIAEKLGAHLSLEPVADPLERLRFGASLTW